ncbi:MAG: hypothetical protein K2K64_11615 [Muribaculaceae bacterium]|nr:hypothetical protein [Muribaculaceae bacterium]MDE7109188.1 hypothetical protein [Muribaculaceae bacterium]
MNKYFFNLLIILFAGIFLTACDKDETPHDYSFLYIEGIYQVDGKYSLTGTVNGMELEKGESSVTLVIPDKSSPTKATLMLSNIIPDHSSLTFSDVTLNDTSSNSGMSFEATKIVNETKVSIKGTVTATEYKGIMTIDITAE